MYFDRFGVDIYTSHSIQTRLQYDGLYGYFSNNIIKHHRQNMLDKISKILKNC